MQSIVYQQFFSNFNPANGKIFGIEEGKGRCRILAQEITRIQQQTFVQPFDMKNMIMTAADQVKVPGAGQFAGPIRIMLNGDTQCSGD